MKRFILLAFFAFVSTVQYSFAQTSCKGSAGSMTLTASNLITSPSVVTLAFTHFGAASGWGVWQNQLSYKLSSGTMYINCSSTVSGLIPGAKYDFRVSATRFCLRDGFTTQSQTVGAFVTNYQLKPNTPTALPPNAFDTDFFVARWNKNGGIADHYIVDVALDQAFNSIVLSNLDAGPNDVLIVRGLMPGTRYYYRVLASTPVGNSSYSNISEFTTVVSPPTMLPATNIGATSFTANGQTSGVVTHCFLKVLEVTVQPDLGEIVLDVDAGTNTSFTVTGLKPNTKYFYFVRVTNDITTSPFFLRSDAAVS